jgi:hypothetical protein
VVGADVADGVVVGVAVVVLVGVAVVAPGAAVAGAVGEAVFVVVGEAGLVAVGEAVVGVVGEAGLVAVGEAVVGVVGEAVVGVVSGALGVAVAPPLATVKFLRRLDLEPSDHVSTTLMVCDPSASFLVSYGIAVPSPAVPAKSKGGSVSVRKGGLVRHRPSR